MDHQQSLSILELTVAPRKLPLFTTVLQSGIEIITKGDTSLGQLLGALPGFTADYLANTVQTIFLNGTAIDDLTTVLSGEKPVIALSAAMPGLAGAIFRKNSFHAALRSDTKIQSVEPNAKPIRVTLKLFNSIALERGEELLSNGVSFISVTFSRFLLQRPGLLQEIRQVRLNGEKLDPTTLLDPASLPAMIQLKILDGNRTSHD